MEINMIKIEKISIFLVTLLLFAAVSGTVNAAYNNNTSTIISQNQTQNRISYLNNTTDDQKRNQNIDQISYDKMEIQYLYLQIAVIDDDITIAYFDIPKWYEFDKLDQYMSKLGRLYKEKSDILKKIKVLEASIQDLENQSNYPNYTMNRYIS